MQAEPRPPVERHRRSARASVPPLAQTPQPEGAVERASHARTDLNRRTPQETRRTRKAPVRVPAWLTAAVVCALVASLALFTTQQRMSAYLTRRAEEKRETYASLVTGHPRYFTEYIFQYADEYNLQPAYVSAIILNESSYSPTAVSRLGARGLMQLMEDTAKWINDQYLHVSGYSFQMLWDPETNIRFGCWYLGYLMRRFDGDMTCAVAAYHAGQGQVDEWLKNPAYSDDGKTLKLIPSEKTDTYVKRVLKYYEKYCELYASEAA